MKKVLFVYPHNFLEQNMGTNIRIYALAKELHAMGYEIDLFALENFMSRYDRFDEMNEKEGLINRLYLYDYKKIKSWKKRKRRLQKCYKFLLREELDNWVSPQAARLFNRIVTETEYSHIVMFYAYTAELFSPKHYAGSGATQKVYFMEDLLSLGEYIQGKSRAVGELLDCEVKRLMYFDKIVCISSDEKIFIEKLLPGQRKFYFLPHLTDYKSVPAAKDVQQQLRVTFVGYDNPYNVEGVRWFLNHVCPLLDEHVKITIIGRVNRCVFTTRPNVTQIEFAENLDEVYCNTDVIICPLLNGTGMKIKVIEAMSYGIPVVCTPCGVDGFPDKTHNGCLIASAPEDFAAHIDHLAQDSGFYDECRKRVADYFIHVLSWERHRTTLAQIFG